MITVTLNEEQGMTRNPSSKRRRNIKTLIYSLITLVFLALIIWKIEWQEITGMISSVSIYIILITWALYMIQSIAKGARFYILLDRQVPLLQMVKISIIHNFYNVILPFRTGEISILVLLKSKRKITQTKTIGLLLINRFFDFLIVISLFFLGLIMLGNKPEIALNAMPAIIIVGALILLALLSLAFLNSTYVKILDKIMNIKLIKEFKLVKWGFTKLKEVVVEFKNLKDYRKTLSILFLTMIIFTIMTYVNVLFVHEVNPTIDPFVVVIAVGLVLLSNILPTYLVAGYGTTEIIYALLFMTSGVVFETGLAIGLYIHTLFLILVLLTTGLALLIKR
ncbi:flippase-like domain-containing protein [Candidatus Woesearchaeota archaeon]|nr:flippase-like domain-containing protein [Candidatus Woesearchaeota archaeon]